MLQIHFYLNFQESSQNALGIVITLKSATFNVPETAIETKYFMIFTSYFNMVRHNRKFLQIVTLTFRNHHVA